MTDPISDMLIRIKNAQMAKKEQVLFPYSKMKFAVATVLKESGFINDIEKRSKKLNKSEQDYLNITLKYQDNEGAISDIKIISKPSRRMYIKASEIRAVRSGYGIMIVSTSKGIMTSKNARKEKLGGEALCEVW